MERNAGSRASAAPGRNGVLTLAAIGDFAVAAAAVAALAFGTDGFTFFSEERLARLHAEGSIEPILFASGAAALALLWGIYALSGSGRIRRLPLLRVVLIVATLAFFARGSWLAAELGKVVADYTAVRFRELMLSALALVLAFLHLAGVRNLRRR